MVLDIVFKARQFYDVSESPNKDRKLLIVIYVLRLSEKLLHKGICRQRILMDKITVTPYITDVFNNKDLHRYSNKQSILVIHIQKHEVPCGNFDDHVA